ncbi:MAG: pyruvate carboxylase [Salinisphaeraceae bacterium]|nr:pyruvate carboxylase [Salinisphaeraceae bacterium]
MKIRKLLVANRGEIAIRIMRAAAEMGIRTVSIYAYEDRFALHRFKADESYLVGKGAKPIAAYLDIQDIIRVARETGADAIHPGYGFLSENDEFAEACEQADILFVGPSVKVLRTLGDKVSARAAAVAADVPVLPASDTLPENLDEVAKIADEIGYPVMLKASWGGGGRGMRVIKSADELRDQVESGRREAKAAFGNDEGYLEKLVVNARHVEVQILGDTHGNVIHLFERDCTVQRRHQKVAERAPAPYLSEQQRESLCGAAVRLCQSVDYHHAGTVEFLMDADSGEFFFIEVNPRIQVEHTVTEEVTGVDIVRAQLRISEGGRLGDGEHSLPGQSEVSLDGHALQCRVTTEDPENGFAPDYGRLTVYRSPAGLGVRLDGGTAYSGAVITPYYDSLLVKVTVWAQSLEEVIPRMDRTLREFRIRGLSTNLQFLENVIAHPSFKNGDYTTSFIDETPELFEFVPRRDRATKLLRFLGDVIVNGHPEMKGRTPPALPLPEPRMPEADINAPVPRGTRDELLERGPEGFSKWLLEQKRVMLTDTSMRDAHQSLFATRMRTRDMLEIAPYYARQMSDLFSVECWGGATFDVSMRFLKEDPWLRLSRLRERMPNIPLQMLLRASNAVGYTNYADNVVRFFIQRAADTGIDIFRVFDALNWVDNMRVAIDEVVATGKVCEATICYSGDLLDPKETQFTLDYYIDMGRKLEAAGAHIIGIKDMAGVCKPGAASRLVTALKSEISLPIHFHTHDTSGISAASALAAVEAGVDAVDGAMDALSGLASQPNLGAMAAALRNGERDPGIDGDVMQQFSDYWEGVRRYYAPFESNVHSGTADVYNHAMPGGQYSNLREQARSMGLTRRWPEISRAYADVNRLFGNIVKVTPTSKVVGDMALYMVSNDLTPEQVADPDHDIDFPASVISFFRGEMGRPPNGFPEALQKKVLRGEAPLPGRPGETIEAVDLEAERRTIAEALEVEIDDNDLASYLMYPEVFTQFAEHRANYGEVSRLPTTSFFYGLLEKEEISVDIEPGKTLVISLQGRAEDEEEGYTKLFYELNGQPRMVRVAHEGADAAASAQPKVDPKNPDHVGAPIPGMVVRIAVKEGQRVKKGDPLLALEAMKMETGIAAPRDAVIAAIHTKPGATVAAKDLLIEIKDDSE